MKKSRFLKKFLLVLAIGGGLLLPAASPAQANILIMPIRIVFGPRDRMQDITVLNTSETQAGTYRLAWVYAKQTEEGAYTRLDTPLNPELDPEQTMLFSPRQVTLPPGGKQRVRMSLRRPPNLPDGEYRAHLYLKNAQRQKAGSIKTEGGVNVGMGISVGLAIPVIIRQGEYDGTASIGTPQFLPAKGKTPPLIAFPIERGGKHSTVGNVMVYWQPPGEDEEILIARQNAVNIFPEVSRRLMDIPLKESRVIGGSIRIIYEGDGPDKGIVFDEKVFPVGG